MAARDGTRALDLVGLRFGRLIVVSPSSRRSSTGKIWVCRCDCGAATEANSLKLRSGHTKSCGCLSRDVLLRRSTTHGMSDTRTYRSWKEMRRRCSNPEAPQWTWYGGRGISVCASWSSFETFLADMGERPLGTTLDRIDPDGNYEPSNCRWATPKQQAETNRGTFKTGARPRNKVSEEAVLAMAKQRTMGMTYKAIAAAHGINPVTASYLLRQLAQRRVALAPPRTSAAGPR